MLRKQLREPGTNASPYNKRAILQPILDKIEPGWDILRPSSDGDIDTKCFFQHIVRIGHYRQAEVDIPNKYFLKNDLDEIELRVRWAVAYARKV